ncbi:integrase arm-type DNA-binding domain-containing protein [Sulfitobacter mediterraneus]|uniref:tyrosine-type recombinase/integrase n=1 Tax=Sulfitobacter mediterraneus TaxID=83219 RepID=UPI00193A9DA7|nr:integrase arm-type DNA-binding domain-containing protein [Sulfitobacter mediterraneus]MBM1558764.1 integrase arm-type DNA-binding domain-containing protein [Sulfitobacter mediterraneus]MBM1569600.1 integrase arm-type DNA-binding domain-containing protein [Sulfitobacter mediterraneus]MBM1573177.1 integrase arm-type DNA-binding domain-containing protein [Sulfitobacter mediterraneus]MBM1577207.1 integrase arm-type DNA-binding domain-containing protein [Sulfitobacter mediterraneus]MBM1580962.1 
MKLSARKVETAGVGRHGDGRGLFLFVKPTLARSWVLRYQVQGRRHDLGLGAYPDVTLAMARQRATDARRMILDGDDPIAKRRQAQPKNFKDAALELIESKRSGWKNAKHAAQWTSTLEAYVFPTLGPMQVTKIATADVVGALKPIWSQKPETANRVRQRIEAVLDYASALGIREGDNPARWRGHLDNLLPKPTKVRAVQHHPALSHADIPDFMEELSTRKGVSARALTFTILTAARSGETRGMTWAEVDLNNGVWTIPARRMKAAKEHRIPLSLTAIAQLGERGADTDLVFGSETKAGKPISDMSMTALLRRMEYDNITVHGFRSTFRDWAGETTSFPREVIEAALAHGIKNKAEAAYARGDLFDKRRTLMEAWADFTEQNDFGMNVIALSNKNS